MYKQVWWETVSPQRSCRLYNLIKDSTQHQDFLFSLEGPSMFSPARERWGHSCRSIRCVDHRKVPTTRSPQFFIFCISRKATKTKVSKRKLPLSAFIWLLDRQPILKIFPTPWESTGALVRLSKGVGKRVCPWISVSARQFIRLTEVGGIIRTQQFADTVP